MQKIIVDIDSAGCRLDKFLAKNGFGFTLAQKLLRQKDVKVNGKKVDAAHRLEQGDEVKIFNVSQQSKTSSKTKPKIDAKKLTLIKDCIIYQDKNILAIDKPAGIAVQSGNPKDFSIDAALPFLKLDLVETPRLVHRLDRDTSGILLLARNRKAAAFLSEGFKNKTINKTYLALVKGIPAKAEDTISMPLLEKQFGQGTKSIKKVFKSEAGKESITHYKILQIFDDYSLLELKPVTGRMHQLRVHCKEIGHPILGDRKYNKSLVISHKSRLCLHSFKIEISDFFGKKLVIESKKPDFLV